MINLRDVLLGDCSAEVRGHCVRLLKRQEGSRGKTHQCHGDETLHEVGALDVSRSGREGAMNVQERLDGHVCCKLNETIRVSQRLLVRQDIADRFNDLVGLVARPKVF